MKWASDYALHTYTAMPLTLTMREIGVGGLVLITSLLDARQVSKDELLELYHARWHIELDLRAIKSVMQMDVGHGQGSLMLEVAGCLDQARHFLPTQYDWQGAWQVCRLHAGHDFGVIERDVKEELQAADGGIQ
jgi:hypothetical protein